jgi:leader peptidase (prepilin peptidase)/N-methyltransferase
VFLLGAAVGSFLNVVVARLPAGQSLVRPRSRCPRCGAAIAWYDNLPLLSWVLLRARCRSCRARISVRYPLVEALGGAAALLAFERHGLSARAAAELAFAAALLALAFIDLDTWLLPHAITWPLIAAGALLSALGLTAAGLGASLLGAAIGFAVFALVAWLGEKVFRREALGFGDVWLLAGLGAWLGPGALLPLVLLASLQGSAVGIALLLLGRGTPGPTKTTTPAASSSRAADPTTSTSTEDDWVPPRNAVPFGPFLVAGALEWLYLAAPMARLFPPLEVFR